MQSSILAYKTLLLLRNAGVYGMSNEIVHEIMKHFNIDIYIAEDKEGYWPEVISITCHDQHVYLNSGQSIPVDWYGVWKVIDTNQSGKLLFEQGIVKELRGNYPNVKSIKVLGSCFTATTLESCSSSRCVFSNENTVSDTAYVLYVPDLICGFRKHHVIEIAEILVSGI
jgi:hypothetical protein